MSLIALLVILVGISIAPFVSMFVKYLIVLATIKYTPADKYDKLANRTSYTSKKLPWERKHETHCETLSDTSLSDKDRKAIAKAVADGIYYSRIREGKNPGNYTLTEGHFDD